MADIKLSDFISSQVESERQLSLKIAEIEKSLSQIEKDDKKILFELKDLLKVTSGNI